MPEVGIYDSPEVNAFATGPSQSRSLVAVSTGLLSQMDQSAIEGVLGHEITHIKNGDMVTMALFQGVINSFVFFFARIITSILLRSDSDDRRPGFLYFIVLNIVQIGLSFLGAIIVCWFSRQREFRADAGGAELAGRGSMVGALRSLLANQARVDNSQAALTTMKIAGGPMALFSTHPPLEAAHRPPRRPGLIRRPDPGRSRAFPSCRAPAGGSRGRRAARPPGSSSEGRAPCPTVCPYRGRLRTRRRSGRNR